MSTEAAPGGRADPATSDDVAAVADGERRTERRVAAAFLVTAAAATALAFVYWTGGHPQWEGLLLAVALGGLGVGFVATAKGLLPGDVVEQEREPLAGEDEIQKALEEDIEERVAPIGRRKLLTRSLGLGALALVGAFSFPIRSLGPGPGNKLSRTPWRNGSKLVDDHGRPVQADEVAIGTLITVFPEGHTDAADAQAVLIRVGPDDVRPAEGRETWSPEGFLAFSKICTHAGCPVGLYQAATRQLLCPCHQSAFDVLKGAKPVFGPAARPLPQLPLEIGADGELRATGDFSEPVGPTYWNIDR